MINISTEETKVVCTITGNYPINKWTFAFDFDVGREAYALLLADHLRDAIGDKLRRMKANHYEQGRNDQRKRNRKRTAFCTNWEVDR